MLTKIPAISRAAAICMAYDLSDKGTAWTGYTVTAEGYRWFVNFIPA